LGWASMADSPTMVLATSDVVSYLFQPDGTPLFPIPWGLFTEEVLLTGEASHYLNLAGKGHIINDGRGVDKGQEFVLDPFYGQLPDRTRHSGPMELILFDCCTGTLAGTITVIHEVFGTAGEVLPLYPWAESWGSEMGKGWWFIGTELQVWTPSQLRSQARIGAIGGRGFSPTGSDPRSRSVGGKRQLELHIAAGAKLVPDTLDRIGGRAVACA